MLVHAPFGARKDLESSFHCCRGPVRLVLASFTTGLSYEGRAGFFECRANRTKKF